MNLFDWWLYYAVCCRSCSVPTDIILSRKNLWVVILWPTPHSHPIHPQVGVIFNEWRVLPYKLYIYEHQYSWCHQMQLSLIYIESYQGLHTRQFVLSASIIRFLHYPITPPRQVVWCSQPTFIPIAYFASLSDHDYDENRSIISTVLIKHSSGSCCDQKKRPPASLFDPKYLISTTVMINCSIILTAPGIYP